MQDTWEDLDNRDRIAIETLFFDLGPKRFSDMVRAVYSNSSLDAWSAREELAARLEDAWQGRSGLTLPRFHCMADAILRQWESEGSFELPERALSRVVHRLVRRH